jgi:hypothetical protein
MTGVEIGGYEDVEMGLEAADGEGDGFGVGVVVEAGDAMSIGEVVVEFSF